MLVSMNAKKLREFGNSLLTTEALVLNNVFFKVNWL